MQSALALQRVVHRCLEKNPEQRFQSDSDLAFALEAGSESGIASAVAIGAPGRRKSRKPLLWSACMVAILTLATIAYFFSTRQQHMVFEYYSLQKAIDNKHVRKGAISPDGTYVASVIQNANSKEALWVHHVPTNTERPANPAVGNVRSNGPEMLNSA